MTIQEQAMIDLKKYGVETGKNLKELAQELGMKQHRIYQISGGNGKMTLEEYGRIQQLITGEE